MSELRVPLDVEQLAEMSQLRSLLRSHRQAAVATPVNPREIESAASFLFLRLFIVLGYLARSTNKPGRLTAAGALQFRESLEPLYGDNCDPVRLLEESRLLEPTGGEWHCPLFAKLNEHLAGDYRPKHMKGNDMRQVGIAIKEASVAATQQALMVLPEVLRRADGTTYDPQELDRLMLLIGTLDKIFKFTRQRTQFTEPLLASAAAACVLCNYTSRVVPEELRQFLGWLINHRDHPRVPSTTDQLLADFENLYLSSKS